jgi:peptidoglycan/LPS O-acetylase OafA/YrhL
MLDRGIRAYGGARMLVGCGLIVMPRTISRHWAGSDPDHATLSVYSPAVGIRELALGALTWQSSGVPGQAVALCGLGAAADAVDAAAAFAAARRSNSSSFPRGCVVPAAAALCGTVLAVVAGRQRGRTTPGALSKANAGGCTSNGHNAAA